MGTAKGSNCGEVNLIYIVVSAYVVKTINILIDILIMYIVSGLIFCSINAPGPVSYV